MYVAPIAAQGFEDLVNVSATPDVSETAPVWSPDGSWSPSPSTVGRP